MLDGKFHLQGELIVSSSVPDLVKSAEDLLNSGLLLRHDESFVTAVVSKFERGNNLASSEISRLREILAYYSGHIAIERTCSPALAMEVFIAEGAHIVDFFYMTPLHRERIFAIYHAGDITKHDHGWFEETGNNDYWSWVGESLMYGFQAAFSSLPLSTSSFSHQTTMDIGAKIREVLKPAGEIVRRVRSSVVHRMGSWHERQIPDMLQETVALSDIARLGLRKCKTCRWDGVA